MILLQLRKEKYMKKIKTVCRILGILLMGSGLIMSIINHDWKEATLCSVVFVGLM